MSSIHQTRPFLKWAGNKYRCLKHIIPALPSSKRLIEPFAGSGAIFLNSNYDSYILGEQNPHLINLYQYLKTENSYFIEFCKQWFLPEFNNSAKYYEMRQCFNTTQDQRLRAALFLYLNRHAYNGLCRFNKQGLFNVPFGSYIKPYFPEKEMMLFSKKLKQAKLIKNDYKNTFELGKANDVIYCDPPYFPINSTANFTAYTKHGFNNEEQIALSELALKASNKGCHVFISNHDLPSTRDMYSKANHIYEFSVPRTIGCNGKNRKPVKEILAYFKPK